MMDALKSSGITVNEDGFGVRNGKIIPIHWAFSEHLPKPEDYILERSGTTLEDIYKAAEWEGQRPTMPAPMVMDGGPVQPLPAAGLSLMPRNRPRAEYDSDYAANRPGMAKPLNRKQRRIIASQQRRADRKSAKRAKVTLH